MVVPRSKQLNFRQIEVFRAIMIARSISGAAQLLFVSQPAVSRLLAQTEAGLGFLLFERVKGRLYPTPEAERLFVEVNTVYAGLQRVNEVARDFSEHRGGLLRLLAHSTLGQTFMPEAIAAFRAAHPEVQMTFESCRQTELQKRMVDGDGDIAVTIFPLESASLALIALCKVPLVCLMPAGHALAAKAELVIADLLNHPVISYAQSSPFGIYLEALVRERVELASAHVEVGSPQNAGSLVRLGLGLALMDGFSALGHEAQGLSFRPVRDVPMFEAIAVHRRFNPMSQAGNAFVGKLLDLARNYRPAHAFMRGEGQAASARP